MDQSTITPVTNYCTFMGLPSSGKTSFIGALWHVVESGEIDSAYTITIPPDDREYLNRLRKNFLDCQAPERTKTGFVERVEITVTERSTGKVATFIFPDLSGETFVSQFEYRKLATDYVEQVSKCNSLMLFVNPLNIKKSFLISELNGMLDNKTGISDQTTESNESASSTTLWTPKMCQTQVIIVDLIQMIRKNVSLPYKVGVIISAWDTISKFPYLNQIEITPDQWLLHNLPLLSQYLEANQVAFPSKVFGISAQGGEYNQKDNSELQSKMRQSERLIVQLGNTINHDITIPLKWLFDE